MISEIILLFLGLFFLYKWMKPVIPLNFPPGPTNYPVVGGAFAIQRFDPELSKALIKMSEVYGDLIGIYMGKTLTLVVNGYENIKEVLTREEFNGRPKTFEPVLNAVQISSRGGIMFNSGESWKEQRRFTLRHLRDLGFGKSSLEGIIQDEISDLLKIVERDAAMSDPEKGLPLDNIFGVSIINVLWLVVSGKRFKHDDEEFKDILVKLAQSFRSGMSSSLNIVADYPWLRFLPYFSEVYKNFIAGSISITELLKESVEEHKRARISHQNSTDFMTAYLTHLEELTERGTGNGTFSENQLVSISTDLFSAGAESTSNSIAFAMLYMLLYPEIQTKVQNEIDSVVSKGRLPSLTDRSRLPYCEAVLDELFRCTSIAPLTVPHLATERTQLNGYTIPNNTLVMINLASVHLDKSHFVDPEAFRPERFIDAHGKFVKSEKLIPFGFGKRVCPGEALARMNYFLFFTAMMQKFRLGLVPGTENPSKIPLAGFTVAPQPFKAILTLRI